MADSPPLKRMLVIDSSSRRVCVGVFDSEGHLNTTSSEEDASVSLFPIIKDLFDESGTSLATLGSIAFCEGPGSMLGIRTAVMGIRTWQGAGFLRDQSVFSFNSLNIGAEIVREAHPSEDRFLVATDARRNSWNTTRVEGPDADAIRIIANADLEKDTLPLFSFHEFPTWTRTKAKIALLPYRPETVFASPTFPELLTPNPEVNPLNLRSMEFAKWKPVARTADQIES